MLREVVSTVRTGENRGNPIRIFLPRLNPHRISSLQMGLDKILRFGYCRVDESRWMPAGTERAAGSN